MALVPDPHNIRLGIAGKVDENDHPYSWSAILNGYDPAAMRQFAAPVISEYLTAQPVGNFGIPGVRVTHIWCDDAREAKRIMSASRIDAMVDGPEQLIGNVDAVLIPTDRGEEHVRRARPFVEAGLPVFVDKPLCDNLEDLRVFEQWVSDGGAILSCSALRFALEFEAMRERLGEVGQMRLISVAMAKSWRRYGIHALEAVYPFLEPGGWISATNSGRSGAEIVAYEHRSGVQLVVMVGEDCFGGFGCLNVYGTKSRLSAKFGDSFSAFKRQLAAFVEYLRTGRPPFPFNQRRELIHMLIAGDKSRAEGGRRFTLPL